MKVIDLLNRIANGEEVPLKIEVEGYIYRKSNGQYWCDETEMYLIDNCTSIYKLNKEVEIIEEDKKIEKLTHLNNVSNASDLVAISQMQWENNSLIERKINEIIDYINKE